MPRRFLCVCIVDEAQCPSVETSTSGRQVIYTHICTCTLSSSSSSSRGKRRKSSTKTAGEERREKEKSTGLAFLSGCVWRSRIGAYVQWAPVHRFSVSLSHPTHLPSLCNLNLSGGREREREGERVPVSHLVALVLCENPSQSSFSLLAYLRQP